VLGLKDSSGDMNYLKQALATVKDKEDFSVLLGPEHLLLEGLSAGVHGGVCGGANLMPRIFVDLFDAFRAEDLDLARTLQVRIVEVGTPLYLTGESQSSYIRGLKASLEVAGICSGKLAWPYLPEEPEEMTHVREHLSHYPETKYSAPNLQPR
jgi:dihydrodipicolinate synthase/N-acetylneuraminate lyase